MYFSFRMASYDGSFDIPKCYLQVRTAEDFLYASFNIWFDDMIYFQNPLVVLRDYLSFGYPVACLIVKIICYLYVDLEIRVE